MSGFLKKLETMNQTIRTFLMLVITGAVGFGGYLGYDRLVKPAMQLDEVRVERDKLAEELKASEGVIAQQKGVISHQQETIGTLEKENERLATSLRLIKVDRRLAYLTITSLREATETEKASMTVLFTEVDENGKAIETPRLFELDGNLLSVDCWLAKFQDKYIESADLARGSSLCIIRGIKGSQQAEFQPIDEGVPYLPDEENPNLDPRPAAYRSQGQISELEQKIWSDFWTVANDLEMQEELGIRAVHGQVNYIEVKEVGAVYKLELRASDGGTIKKVDNPPAVALPKMDAA